MNRFKVTKTVSITLHVAYLIRNASKSDGLKKFNVRCTCTKRTKRSKLKNQQLFETIFTMTLF